MRCGSTRSPRSGRWSRTLSQACPPPAPARPPPPTPPPPPRPRPPAAHGRRPPPPQPPPLARQLVALGQLGAPPSDTPAIRSNAVIDVGDDELQAELGGKGVQQIEQCDGVGAA